MQERQNLETRMTSFLVVSRNAEAWRCGVDPISSCLASPPVAQLESHVVVSVLTAIVGLHPRTGNGRRISRSCTCS